MADRLTFALEGDALTEVSGLAVRKGVNEKEVIRRALALYFVVNNEVTKEPENREPVITEGESIITRIKFA